MRALAANTFELIDPRRIYIATNKAFNLNTAIGCTNLAAIAKDIAATFDEGARYIYRRRKDKALTILGRIELLNIPKPTYIPLP